MSARSRAYPRRDEPAGPPIDREKPCSDALAAACLGREAHAAAFAILALRQGHQVALVWEIAATGERGTLGVLERYEVVPIVQAMYAQLQKWRERCEERPCRSSKGAGA